MFLNGNWSKSVMQNNKLYQQVFGCFFLVVLKIIAEKLAEVKYLEKVFSLITAEEQTLFRTF